MRPVEYSAESLFIGLVAFEISVAQSFVAQKEPQRQVLLAGLKCMLKV
jgi:hypothetical protein